MKMHNMLPFALKKQHNIKQLEVVEQLWGSSNLASSKVSEPLKQY
jgi:hypothetical protein